MYCSVTDTVPVNLSIYTVLDLLCFFLNYSISSSNRSLLSIRRFTLIVSHSLYAYCQLKFTCS